MNITFIGGGHVFGYHSGQFRSVFKNDNHYVVEPNDLTASKAYIPRINFEEAVKIADLAIIMTPSRVRWEVCEPFIKKGTPLVIEKPLTINWEEISLFEEAAKHSWICPIVNARVQKGVEEIVANIKNPKNVKVWKIRNLNKEYYMGWHGKYTTDGGVLAQQGFHCLDLACWIGGKPISVKAIGKNDYHKIECEDTARVEIEFESGCLAEVNCTTASHDRNNAGLIVDRLETSGLQFSDKGKAGHTILAERIKEALDSFTGPPITVESVIPSLRTLHACYVSMDKNGESVKVGEKHLKLGS